MPLKQVRRREFGALVPRLTPGEHRIVLREGTNPAVARHVDLLVPDRAWNPREYQHLTPNLPLLDRIARQSGGRIDANPRSVLEVRGGATRARWPLAQLLIPLALILILIDIAARRYAG